MHGYAQVFLEKMPLLISAAIAAGISAGLASVRSAAIRRQEHLETQSRITCVRDGEVPLDLADASAFAHTSKQLEGQEGKSSFWHDIHPSLHPVFHDWARERGVPPDCIPPKPKAVKVGNAYWVVNTKLLSRNVGTANFPTSEPGVLITFGLEELFQRARDSEGDIGHDLAEVEYYEYRTIKDWMLGRNPNFTKDPSWTKWVSGRKVRVKKIVLKYAMRVKERFPVMKASEANYMTVRRYVQQLLATEPGMRATDAAKYTDLIVAYSFVPSWEQIRAAELFNSRELGAEITRALIRGSS